MSVSEGQGLSRLVVVTGPTGTGKSDLALAMAEKLGGEVINADSMQIYCGMDIGTAKLTVAQRRGVPHHLLDILDVTQQASVAKYQAEARAAVEDVLDRGRVPLLVGGSGLYIQAVVDEISFPATDAVVRKRLEEELAACGTAALWQRLAASDPAAAAVIEQRNGRRIVRALEVIEVTGRPFTATFPKPGAPRYDAALICLDRDTEALDARLAQRVQSMMDQGFLDEVRTLEQQGLRNGLTAWRALGYRQLLALLDGAVSEIQAIEDTIVATRRFVRRQRSWFRRDTRLTWIDASSTDLAQRAMHIAQERAVGWTS